MGVLYARVNGAWVPITASSGGDGNPTGTVITGIWSVAPVGYLLFPTIVPNADVAYPDLWAIAPASWKSGTTLNLPDLTDRMLMVGGTVGAVGGSNTITLAAANLPPHVHDSGTISAVSGGAHQHGPGTLATDTEAAHTHGPASPMNQFMGTAGSASSNIGSGAVGINTAAATAGGGAHSHAVTTGLVASGGAHTHTTTGNTGNGPGTSTAISIVSAHLRVRAAIKT